jgi:hypothetical protein
MTHGDKVLAFLNVGTPKEVEAYFECETCFKSVKKAQVVDGYALFTCPKGHDNRIKV